MICDTCNRPLDSSTARRAAVVVLVHSKAALLTEARLTATDPSRPCEWIFNASRNLVDAEKHAKLHQASLS